MKLIKRLTYLLTALPAIVLLPCGCTDEVMEVVELSPADDGAGVYVSVVINTQPANVTRAGADDSFYPTGGEEGDGKQDAADYENAVHNLTLYFFDGGTNTDGTRPGINATDAGNIPIDATLQFSFEAGNLYGTGTTYRTTTQKVENLVIGKTYDVLAIVNIDTKTKTNFETLAALRDAATVEAITHPHEGDGWYVMSSANPTFDATQGINSVRITADNSRYNPATVSIDVERLAARVDCHFAETNDTYGLYAIEGTGTATGDGTTPTDADWVQMQSLIVVNKYVSNGTNKNYWFKRVSNNATNLNAFTYLDNETTDNTNNSTATNYVIAPMTAETPATGLAYDHPFEHVTNIPAMNWVTIEELEEQTVTSTHEDITYNLVDYTQENVFPASVMADGAQREKYATGVVFKAQYQPGNKATADDGTFYWYMNTAYANLNAIATAHTEFTDITLTDDNCADYGILHYPEGTCYYTYWIRHADDGDPETVSPMEYAIVRNNIYQLNVTKVHGIGTPTPSDDAQLLITVYAKDWTDVPTNEVIW